MDPKRLYNYALNKALAVGLQASVNDWKKPTPDKDWNVEALMKHMLYELVWFPDVVHGKTVAEVGDAHEGELLGDDMASSWRKAIETARQATNQADLNAIAHLSYADKHVYDYLLESADDIVVHTWDLGQAIGVPVTIDEEAAHPLFDYMSTLLVSGGSGGLFALPVPVPANAGGQTKLLALLGRSENWAQRT